MFVVTSFKEIILLFRSNFPFISGASLAQRSQFISHDLLMKRQSIMASTAPVLVCS